MRNLKLLSASTLLLSLAVAPGSAEARNHRHHWLYGLPYEISYNHNYGPGPLLGTFAYYDGPSTNSCVQSAATYLGQDRRRHPCF
jgi:hypothetical protein